MWMMYWFVANLRRHGLKLNPENFVFGMRTAKFLGCMISEPGIEANSEKIEAIRRMKASKTQREV
jgi:hypothetical protein